MIRKFLIREGPFWCVYADKTLSNCHNDEIATVEGGDGANAGGSAKFLCRAGKNKIEPL
jgi:hypothetical protein